MQTANHCYFIFTVKSVSFEIVINCRTTSVKITGKLQQIVTRNIL